MKKYILTTLTLFSLLPVTQAQTKNYIDLPYIEVTGYADTLITPNEIYIKIFLSEKDSKNKVSIEESEIKMVEALNELGIDTKNDLTTSDILSAYRFYFLKQKDILKSKEYNLKVSSALMASKVFIRLEDLGISNASIDRVDHTDIEQIKNTCREKAISNARLKAISLTKPISQSVGMAIFISDNDAPLNSLQGKVPGIIIRGNNTLKQKEGDLPAIEFEKINVTASVSAKFILK